jgi:hypothetical protein
MIRQLALTPGNDVPRLEHPLKLNPQEKIRLVLNTHQTVYRIKNCCGELNGLLALNNLCFNIRNRDSDKDFNAEAGTTLTEILNHPQIITFVRVLTVLTQKPKRCYFVKKESVNDERDDSAAATAAVQSPATDDDDNNNKVDSTTKDHDTAASPTDDSRKKAEEEEEEDETDFLPCCICDEELASLWPVVDNKADDGPSDTTKE